MLPKTTNAGTLHFQGIASIPESLFPSLYAHTIELAHQLLQIAQPPTQISGRGANKSPRAAREEMKQMQESQGGMFSGSKH